MRRALCLSLLALWLVPLSAFSDVSGRVTLLTKEDEAPARSEDVLLYVEGASGAIPASVLSEDVTVSSLNKEFQPRVEVVPVGKSVRFPNLDDIMHNVFSLSKGNRFDLGLYKNGAAKDYVFESPGLVRVYCNIHPQMSAIIHVMDHPYFAWAQPDGSFQIEGVPPGRYTLRAWHERGQAEIPIVVTETGAAGVDITIDASDYKRRPHLNKFGKPYKRKRGKY